MSDNPTIETIQEDDLADEALDETLGSRICCEFGRCGPGVRP